MTVDSGCYFGCLAFRGGVVAVSDLVLYYVDCEWAFLLAILADIVATVALLMHSRCTKRQYVVLADGRLTVGEAFGQVEKTFPLDAFPYAYLYTNMKHWETVVLSRKPLTAGRIRGLFQLNLANRWNDIVRIPCSFTKQGREIRAYFAGVYAMEEVR